MIPLQDSHDTDWSKIQLLDPPTNPADSSPQTDLKKDSPIQEACPQIKSTTPAADILAIPAYCFSIMPDHQLALIPPAVLAKLSEQQTSMIPSDKLKYLQKQPVDNSAPPCTPSIKTCIYLAILCILAT